MFSLLNGLAKNTFSILFSHCCPISRTMHHQPFTQSHEDGTPHPTNKNNSTTTLADSSDDEEDDDYEDDDEANDDALSVSSVDSSSSPDRSPECGDGCGKSPVASSPSENEASTRSSGRFSLRRRMNRRFGASNKQSRRASDTSMQFSRSSVGGSKYLMAVHPSTVNLSVPATAELVFESRFESANLAKAVMITPTYYELYLRADLYTNRSSQWFYFRVMNTRRGCTYRLSIVNLVKSGSLYNEGMRPLIYSTIDATQSGVGWRRCGENISYFKNEEAHP